MFCGNPYLFESLEISFHFEVFAGFENIAPCKQSKYCLQLLREL